MASSFNPVMSSPPDQRNPLCKNQELIFRPPLNHIEDAERCWKLSVEADPSVESLERLAKYYLRRQDNERWLATLELALKQPDFGLDHARIRVKLSEHFRHQRKWEKAVSYAEPAAESYAHWAMTEACRAHEGAQNWDAANTWYQRRLERYRAGAWEWYEFTKRTGKGDPDTPRQLIQPFVAQLARQIPARDARTAGEYFVLEHNPAKAAQAYEIVMGTDATAGSGLMLALAYIELKDNAKRDSALKKVHSLWNLVNPKEGPGTRIIALGDAITADLENAAKKKGKAGFVDFDKAALEKMYRDAGDQEKIWFAYLVGRYCALHDNKPMAIDYWKRCMASPFIDDMPRTLAGAALLDESIGPEKYKAELNGEK